MVPLKSSSRLPALLAVAALLAAACSSTASNEVSPAPTARETTETADIAEPTPAVTVASGEARNFPAPPPAPEGPLHPDDLQVLDSTIGSLDVGIVADFQLLEANGDPRVLWFVSDLLRFTSGTEFGQGLVDVASNITGVPFDPERPWSDLTNHLLAWDTPAHPDYVVYKAAIFNAVDDRWRFVFSDEDADIDYRLISWGGVLLDDRPLGDPSRCTLGCIPSLDDPALTSAAEGDWYPDDAVVFGLEIEGEAVAFPRNIMEVHEMVNMTIGGRRIALPYCTLCGSAQAYFTDEVDGAERPLVMRTSGLLSRSNKVMYDLDNQSVFDTFAGVAVSGPLRERGVVLQQASVVTSTWADWRAAHPNTQIVAEDGGIGRQYDLDPLDGRDDEGPVFPIGEVDDRLQAQEQVLGIEKPDGTFVAFPADAARATLQNGDAVQLAGVSVVLDGAGLLATFDGEVIASHQAFWFAWSQFHPDTELWLP